jgi:hypothetical protein
MLVRFRETDTGVMDFRETVATCRFAKHLMNHINIGVVSGCLSLS